MNRSLTPSYPTESARNKEFVVAFAKWSHPIFSEENHVESPWIPWPDGTDLDTLGAWTFMAAEAEVRAVGDTPSYRKFQR